MLMAALNFLRFLLLKDPPPPPLAGEGEVSRWVGLGLGDGSAGASRSPASPGRLIHTHYTTHHNTQAAAATTVTGGGGVWSPQTVHTTLRQLRALEANVDAVLSGGKKGAGSSSSSSFRLHMLAEVLPLLIPPLAAAAGEGEGMDV